MGLESIIGSCVRSLALGLAVAFGGILSTPDDCYARRTKPDKKVDVVLPTNPAHVPQLRNIDIDKVEEFAASIKYVPFANYPRIKPEFEKLDSALVKDLDSLLRMSYFYTEGTANNYILKDKERFTQMIYDTSAKMRFRDPSKMSISEFIRWNANIVMYWNSYNSLMLKDEEIAAKVDGAHLDELLYATGGKRNQLKLICRNSSVLLQHVFNCTKDINPNLKNTYCLPVMNNWHMWNLFVTLNKKGAYAASIDITLGDNPMAHMNGNQLDFSGGSHREFLREKGYLHFAAICAHDNEKSFVDAEKLSIPHPDFTDEYKKKLSIYNRYYKLVKVVESLSKLSK